MCSFPCTARGLRSSRCSRARWPIAWSRRRTEPSSSLARSRRVAHRTLPGALLVAVVLAATQPGAEPPEARRAGAARRMNELMLGQGVGGDFTLLDAYGKPTRLADFHCTDELLYFGFATSPNDSATHL